MNKREQTKNRLSAGLSSAAAVFTQQPGIQQTTTEEINNGITNPLNKSITEPSHKTIMEDGNTAIIQEHSNTITEEVNNDSRRGPKKKGEFKKVTLNLDVELNRKLDAYINTLRGRAIEEGTEPPNKSEWVRDVVEEKLRELGVLQTN